MLLLPFASCSSLTYCPTDIDHCATPQLNAIPSIVTPSVMHTASLNLKTNNSKSVYFDPFLDINCSYKCPTEFSDEFLGDPSSLTIFHNNICSLNKNFHKVEEIFQNCSFLPSILAFSETKLHDLSIIPPLKGYSFIRMDSPSSAGGVGLFVSDTLKYSLRPDLALQVDHCEDLWLEIFPHCDNKLDNKSIVVGVVYRHPGKTYETFCDRFCAQLDSLNRNKKDYYICGDFNVNLLKFNLASNVTNYMTAISSMGCNIMVDKPTRITPSGGTCLDHIYSNLHCDNVENYIVQADVSDHYGTFSKINDIVFDDPDSTDVYYRRTTLSDPEWEEFNAELDSSLQHIHSNFVSHNPDNLANVITKTYRSLIDKYMPLKKLSNKRKRNSDKPWITQGLKKSVWTKFKLYKKAKKSGSTSDWQKYKKYLNVLTRAKQKAEQIHYKNLSIIYGQDKSKTWKLINQICNRKRNRNASAIKSLIDKNGVKLEDNLKIADCFNEHFSTVGSLMSNKIESQSLPTRNPLSYIKKDVDASLFLNYTNSIEIYDRIAKLENKKSSGYDLISNRILKFTNSTISPYLETLFNCCIYHAIFPDVFKIAQVIPLYKGGGREDCNNYRPISLLPALGKLLEKLLAIRLSSHLHSHNVLSKHQFGFRENFSTELAVTDIYEKLLHNLDTGLHSCTIFLDLAKAFDSVSHTILLQKLEKYGIRGLALKLFKSYLSNRSQFVKVNGVTSSLLHILYGVPQGSILGPLLFLIFINDLPNATSLYVKLFADDTFLCAQNPNFSALETEVNNELDKVAGWLLSNRLTLNVSKSKFMIVSRKRQIPPFSLEIKGTCLEKCNSYKYLGIFIDKDLNWTTHIQYITKKVLKACGAIAKLRHSLDIEILKNVYYSLVHSYIRYGISVWGNASSSALSSLNSALHKVLRIMTFAPFGNIDLNPIYDFLKILNLDQIFSFELAKFLYKVHQNLLPTSVGNYFEPDPFVNQHSYGLRSRSANLPTRIVSHTKYAEKSMQIGGLKFWNKIPEEIRNSDSLISFKRNFKKFLLEFDDTDDDQIFTQ